MRDGADIDDLAVRKFIDVTAGMVLDSRNTLYLGEGKRECTNACICMGTHIVSLSYRTNRWIFMKLGRDEVLIVPYKCCCFSARSVQWRIKGWAKIGHGGPLLQRTSSSDRKATATNQMHSNDLQACGMKCYYFWFHFEVKFLRVFSSFWTWSFCRIFMQFL